MKKVLTSVCVIAFFLFGLGKGPANPTDSRFGKAVTEFKFTVPLNYNSKTQMAYFFKEYGDRFDVFDGEDMPNANYSNVTTNLIPGKTYTVKILPIIQDGVTPQQCISWLKSQNALLTGSQGLSLLYQMQKESFPQNQFVYCFDELNKLPKYQGEPFIPRIKYYYWCNQWEFTMGDSKVQVFSQSKGTHLLAFFE